MAQKIRTAIIGTGGIANGKHLKGLRAVKDVEVVAICDIIPERMTETKQRYPEIAGAAEYVDYKELLKDESIDCVHVCTPNRIRNK